jgi:cell division transport system permease protein
VIHRLLSAVRRTGRLVIERPRAALWTLFAMTAALVVVGVATLVAANVERWADARNGSGGSMVVYLGEGVDDARATALVGELRLLPGVSRAELVSAAASADRLTRALGADAALLDGVDLARMPASVEVELAPGVRDVVALSPTVRALREAPGVADVVAADPSEDKIASALHGLRAIVWTGAALLAGLALLGVLAALRIRLERPARETRVFELLGAHGGFIAFPSALAGALHGIVAALLAVLAIAGGLHLYSDTLTGALHEALGSVELVVPSLLAIVLFILTGGMLGVLGGGLAGVARAR